MPPKALIFSGHNYRAVVALCRALQARGVPFAVVASGRDDPIFQTAYARQVCSTRVDRALDLPTLTAAIDAADGPTTVLPTSEFLNRALLTHRSELADRGVSLPLCDAATYRAVSDKQSFEDLCRSAGIAVPEQLAPDALQLPLVVKPRHYFLDDGTVAERPVIVREPHELPEHYADPRYLLQSYVPGRSFYLFLCIEPDGRFRASAQENLLQRPGGGSIVAARTSSVHRLSLTRQYVKMLHAAGFYGLVMIELRGSPEWLTMIEANPRPWGPFQLLVDSGSLVLPAFLAMAGLIEAPRDPEPERGASYLWSGGFADIPDKQLMQHAGARAWPTVAATLHSLGPSADLLHRADSLALHVHERRGHV